MDPEHSPSTSASRWREWLPFHRSLLAVGALSAGAVLLATGGVLLTRRPAHLYLVWNLFLALVPLVPALVMHRVFPVGGWRHAWLPAGLWLLFFPNAPYIFTDFIHLPNTAPPWLWGHLLLLVWFSGAGLLAGLVSLRIVHQALATRHSPRTTWCFVAGACLLSGIGVGIGRFERWNSWDAFHAPREVVIDVLQRLVPGHAPLIQVLLPWSLGAFVGLTYLVLWSQAADVVTTEARDGKRGSFDRIPG